MSAFQAKRCTIWLLPPSYSFAARAVLLAIIHIVVAASHACASSPKIEYIEPSGIQRGTEAIFTATGTFDAWPLQVWIDRPGVQITPGEKSGELKVQAPVDTPPGVYWFRLYSATGASTLQPLLVGTLPEARDVEPNNAPGEATGISLPMTISGRLQERGDVDTFSVDAEAGQTLVASIAGHGTFGSPMDAVLQVCTPQGAVLAQNDDARGLDPLLAFRIPKTGRYLVRTFAFPETPNSSIAFSGGPNYVYRLTITTGGFLDYALPLAVRKGALSGALAGGWNISDATTPLVALIREDEVATLFRPDLAGTLEVPVMPEGAMLLALSASNESPLVTFPLAASGCLLQPGEVHSVRFQALQKQKLRIQVAAHQIGYDLDPLVRIYGVDGKLLKEEDDAGADQDDIDFELPIPADGEYRLAVSSVHEAGGPREVYRLRIEEAVPSFQLALDAGEFSMQPGEDKPLKLTVKVERSKGLEGDIVITANDLPAGVTAEHVTSEGKGPTAKSVTLLLKATPEAKFGTFRITGNLAGEVPQTRVARYNVSGSSLGQSLAWLTVLTDTTPATTPAANP